jgi:hypothetical protein
MLCKAGLIIVGVLVLIMGVMGAIPALAIGTEPLWHAFVKIAVGVIAILLGAIAKR